MLFRSHYSKLYKTALKKNSFPEIEEKTKKYSLRLEGMLLSEAFKVHNIYPETMDMYHIYGVIAMCLEAQELGLGKKETIAFCNLAFKRRRNFFKRLIALINLLPNSYSIAHKWNINDHAKREKDHSITYDSFDVQDGRIEYVISKCSYVDIFAYYGIRGLCKIFCMTDETAYAGLTRRVKFTRFSDLSDGPSCHDIVERKTP